MDNLKLKELKQFNTHNENHKFEINHLINFVNLDHLQLQIDDLKKTSFVQVRFKICREFEFVKKNIKF